ncbi:hypothetical protein SAMN05216197_101358, partial [Pseudomonas graminis]
FSGTGFNREEASVITIDFAACPLTPSRLKPVPLRAALCLHLPGYNRSQ